MTDAEDTEFAIEIRDLTKKFGSFAAVDGLEMKVKKKEFMGLLGPNGSGKSTTLKMVTGLIWPTEGSIRINGIDIEDHRNALAKVGCVIETPEFYPTFTPGEAMEYTGRMYGMSDAEIKRRAKEVLEDVKMWDWRNTSIRKFSKGMRQRTVLAQSMLPEPEILILDEPTSGLDPRGMIEMRSVLSDLKKRDLTMLISTHMLKEVSEMCASVSMLRNGRLIAGGDVNELIHDYVRRSAGRVQIDIKSLDRMPADFIKDIGAAQGVRSAEAVGEHEVRLDFEGSGEDQAGLLTIANSHSLRVTAMNEKGLDIEQLYMELTEGEANVR